MRQQGHPLKQAVSNPKGFSKVVGFRALGGEISGKGGGGVTL